jgi:phosphoserine phosphatase
MEDDKGAALQVRMHIGQKITMARYLGTDTMLVSTGEIIDTPVLERGCRTKITTKVADARKVLRQYTGGLHRVIFYGDHIEDIYRLSHFLNFNVVEEC